MSDATKLFLLLSIEGKGGPMPELGPNGPLKFGRALIRPAALQEVILENLIGDPWYRPRSWEGQAVSLEVESCYFGGKFAERVRSLQFERDSMLQHMSSQIDIYSVLAEKAEIRRLGAGCAGVTWGGSITNALRLTDSPEYQRMAGRVFHQAASSSSVPHGLLTFAPVTFAEPLVTGELSCNCNPCYICLESARIGTVFIVR